jgi:hypothetical protein
MTPEEQAAADQKAEEHALAEFASGFEGKPIEGETASAETPQDQPAEVVASDDPIATETEVKEGDEPKTEVIEETPAPEAKITPEQFQELLAVAQTVGDIRNAVEKLRGDAFGKLGGLERTLKGIQDAVPAGVELKVEDLGSISKEYPDLSENLVKGLNSAIARLPKAPAAQPVNLEEIEQRAAAIAQREVDRARVQIAESLAVKFLDAQHEGWKEIVGPKDSDTAYRRWLKTQGAEYERKLLTSTDPVEIGKSLTKFKDVEKKKPAQPKQPVDERKQRLAEAVVPRGGNKPPAPRAKTPEEEFAEGFEYQTAGR